ncbi:hypothetical protein FT663_02661 [Candidozyma haemuli var. vulneris]|uniref:Mediator of RNA polymerase II transcription subunit 9 n=1 Tax=Candidozyma haemuli TaxID=45357 RepID=A0A2V1AML2_9ASCO|nr:hypothetical protein CXQ85_001616 [[Candida] haemuloni]KAF3988090.1 hypothetical protein FT662_03625 [[Candida] haemuloni var. vulneris]KAF3991579.1 hypothetical protein FT663_02661 [[Candida] haemuloni var. vulneris]PVH19310.1 hypothetical protein CXQ85_001616 [[Candida] haemuloni]
MSEESKQEPKPVSEDVVIADPQEQEESALDKVEVIELLPNLFTLLQQLEKGELQPKDFDNHAGTIRMKLNNMRSLLSEISGICEPVEDRLQKIKAVRESNSRKKEFINAFRERVRGDLKDDSGN